MKRFIKKYIIYIYFKGEKYSFAWFADIRVLLLFFSVVIANTIYSYYTQILRTAVTFRKYIWFKKKYFIFFDHQLQGHT